MLRLYILLLTYFIYQISISMCVYGCMDVYKYVSAFIVVLPNLGTRIIMHSISKQFHGSANVRKGQPDNWSYGSIQIMVMVVIYLGC